MNALVRKEIRMILPAWSVAMLLAIFPVWLLWPISAYNGNIEAPGFTVCGPFAIGVLLLGLASFGHEMNYGTFSMLLAQPVSRRRLWLTKTSVLGAGMLVVFAALCVSDIFRVVSVVQHMEISTWKRALDQLGTRNLVQRLIAGFYRDNLFGTLMYAGLSALAAFAGGLWTNLLFRNTSAAFWFTLLIPVGLGMLVQAFFGAVGVVGTVALVITLTAYAVAGFLWARKYFLRVQDIQWTGGILSVPLSFTASARGAGRSRSPLRALFRKELHLHQINLVIAALLLVSHLVAVFVRRMGHAYFQQHPSALMVWESWPLLWLMMPLLIGGVAVSEERKLGTLENFLCLPATRRRQFAIKFFVAMALGVLLGGVIPLLVEGLAALIGLPGQFFKATLMFDWKMVSLTAASLGGSACLTFLAYYASTLTRNLLQAMGLALVFSFVTVVITMFMAHADFRSYYGETPLLWRGPLVAMIGVPLMVFTVLSLGLGNFKQLHIGQKAWLRNLAWIFCGLLATTALTTLAYHRVWELWMRAEPIHPWSEAWPVPGQLFGRGRPSGTTNPRVEISTSRIAVICPDGRLWLRRGHMKNVQWERDGRTFIYAVGSGPWTEGFIGTNGWREAAVSDFSAFAIQGDGTLWNLSAIRPDNPAGVAKRIGSDDNWKKISGTAEHYLALKRDGTLWQWKPNALPGDDPVIHKVGEDSDWVAISDAENISAALKSDGSIWRFRTVRELAAGKYLTNQVPEVWFAPPSQRRPISMSVSPNGPSVAVVCDDGSLWVGGVGQLFTSDMRTTDWTLAQIGEMSDWREARWLDGFGLVAITKRGQICEWSKRLTVQCDDKFAPDIPSHHTDWLAVARGTPETYVVLAADGRLCEWSLPPGAFTSDPSYGQILAPTRIKARLVAEILK